MHGLQEVKQVLDLFHKYEYYYDFQNIPALQMSLNKDQGLIVDMTIGGSRRGGADCGLLCFFYTHITSSEIPHILVGRFAQLLPFTGSEAAASVVHMC